MEVGETGNVHGHVVSVDSSNFPNNRARKSQEKILNDGNTTFYNFV